MTEIKNRYDFVLLFDVKDGNPNGDPDGGNLPRIDPETSEGLVTDVCLKRKLRNFVSLTQDQKPGYEIYVKEKSVLSEQQGRAYDSAGLERTAIDPEEPKEAKEGKGAKKEKKAKRADGDVVLKARDEMCKMFFDVRAFGAVMSLKENNAGQVRGPVQLTFARSIGPVVTLEHSITRMAVATRREAEDQGGDNRTMGRKNIIPYGLYRGFGFVSPALAKQTGFSEEDLQLLWTGFGQMFEHDRSAARGLMSLRKLIVFKHDSALGNAPAHALFDLVDVKRKDEGKPPRDYSDYSVTIGTPPAGVTIPSLM